MIARSDIRESIRPLLFDYSYSSLFVVKETETSIARPMPHIPNPSTPRSVHRFVLCVFTTLAFVASSSFAEAQDSLPSWTNTSGKTIKAEFIKLDGETLVIRKDGKLFNVPLSKFSVESQEQARKLAQPQQQGKSALSQEQLSILWTELHLDLPPQKFQEQQEASLRAVLKLASYPDATTNFVAGKLRPAKMTKEELLGLLNELGSEQEETWRNAYEQLRYVDPRLVMDLEEIFELESVQEYPARHRLADAITGYPIAAAYSMTSRKAELVIEKRVRSNKENEPIYVIVYGKLVDGEFVRQGEHGLSKPGEGRLGPTSFRTIQSLALLESFDTPKSNELIQLMASGIPEMPITNIARGIEESRSSQTSAETVAELWASVGTPGGSQLDYLKSFQSTTLTLLKLSRQPVKTTQFLSEKVIPITLNREECMALLSDLASDDEEKWRAAYGKLSLMDPRLVISVDELLGMWEFQKSPSTRKRLLNLLIGQKLDAPYPTPWQESREIEIKTYGGSPPSFIVDWKSENSSGSMNVGPLSIPRSAEWARITRGLVLLESFNTPLANQIIERMATGHPKATPTQVAQKILERNERRTNGKALPTQATGGMRAMRTEELEDRFIGTVKRNKDLNNNFKTASDTFEAVEFLAKKPEKLSYYFDEVLEIERPDQRFERVRESLKRVGEYGEEREILLIGGAAAVLSA